MDSAAAQDELDLTQMAVTDVHHDERLLSSPADTVLSRRWSDARVLAVMLLAGAILRIVLIWCFHGQALHDDEIHFHQIGVNLITAGEFAYDAGSPMSSRPPLYPAMVAAVYAVFGLDGQDAVRALQALLGLLTVVVVYFLGREMFTPRVGLWAAGICCFYPSLVVSNNLVLTETLFTLLLCLCCLILLRSWSRNSATGVAIAGVVLGLAALTRSVMWLFPPVLAVFVLVAMRELTWRRRVWFAVIPVATFALTIMPWTIRNTRMQSAFTTIDTMGGGNFMMGNFEHTPLSRPWDPISMHGSNSWGSVLSAEEPGFVDMTQGQRDKLAMRRTLDYIARHPGLTLQRSFVKFFHFWQLDRSLVAGVTRGYWGDWSKPATLGLAALVCGAYALVITMSIFGLLVASEQTRRQHWFALLIIFFICGVHTAVFAHARYRLPLTPLLAIFAASGLVNLRGLWARRREWRFRLATLMCGALVVSWCWQGVMDIDHISHQSSVESIARTVPMRFEAKN